MIEKTNHELELKYESQQVYTSSHRFPRYESNAPRNQPQRGEWRDQRSDCSRQDSREQFNNKPIPHDSDNRNSESAMIGNERNSK